MIEKTFVMIKPDALDRKMIGIIIDMIERAGFSINKMQMVHLPVQKLIAHYSEHSKKPFFHRLINGMSNKNAMILDISKENAIMEMRKLSPYIRDSFKDENAEPHENLIHASDSFEAAQRELNLWFD